jgi:hypothetical protein
MSVTAKVLPSTGAQFAANSLTSFYTVPEGTTTIIDKFTAANSDSGSQTLNINIVPSGQSNSDSNSIIRASSMAAGATLDVTAMQNQILAAGDQVFVGASVASKVAIRMSGREIK